MGAPAGTLAVAEIAVGGGSAALARLQLVAVDGSAQRTARIAPFETGGNEDFVEPFFFRLRLDQFRTRHDPGRHHDLATFRHFGGGTHIFDAAVGAGTDEDTINFDVLQRHAGLQAHVIQRHGPVAAFAFVRGVARIGHRAADRAGHFRIHAPGHHRFDLCRVQRHIPVECRAVFRRQCQPARHGFIPRRTFFRCVGAAIHIGVSRIVGRDHAATRTGFDRHITDRHAAFHAHRGEGTAGVFNGMANAARGADFGNHRENDVLG